jgi:peptide/nickel transport system ATP-binding protein
MELDETALREIRGRDISMVFQNPSSHLDPLMRVGEQVAEPLIHHQATNIEDARQKAIERLREVQLDRPEQRVDNYPHQLSGGMKQRVMIASAMSCEPGLLIADEPTTALDVTVQARILDLLKSLNEDHQLSVILISHDLAVVSQVCDRVVVMCQGEIVEQGPTHKIIESPEHPYTQQLIESQPGRIPQVVNESADDEALLQARNVSVEFRLPGRRKLKALDDVSISLAQGRCLGIVGESGSGKSTLARVIMGLVEATSGEVSFRESMKPASRVIQMVFQNPYDSLNPRFTVHASIAEPLRRHGLVPRDEIDARVAELMALVELGPEMSDRRPAQLSGGQCQRVGIARALAMEPEILIADEITSALDVTIQAQIIQLLKKLREQQGLSLIFISHDLALVRSFCDEVAVFRSGKIVESGPVAEVLERPQEEYTQQLIESAPQI